MSGFFLQSRDFDDYLHVTELSNIVDIPVAVILGEGEKEQWHRKACLPVGHLASRGFDYLLGRHIRGHSPDNGFQFHFLTQLASVRFQLLFVYEAPDGVVGLRGLRENAKAFAYDVSHELFTCHDLQLLKKCSGVIYVVDRYWWGLAEFWGSRVRGGIGW
ncbi:hypothetical protein TNIN_369821 [Trichonephila inaurata madagascariensis]|uniref:Uncharacterized protein n=1 Tax=Trichonephila inaurata madagascariensis TaxID=2747483 RepID=A0A8X6MK60_9ARAC|nr:hypothetical protein TNIN_369821 [Trichonephila inaurata madagascariensis]